MQEQYNFMSIMWINTFYTIGKLYLNQLEFFSEHMDEVCSSQLLTSVICMVLVLTQQNNESKEFVKFFHKQLEVYYR